MSVNITCQHNSISSILDNYAQLLVGPQNLYILINSEKDTLYTKQLSGKFFPQSLKKFSKYTSLSNNQGSGILRMIRLPFTVSVDASVSPMEGIGQT